MGLPLLLLLLTRPHQISCTKTTSNSLTLSSRMQERFSRVSLSGIPRFAPLELVKLNVVHILGTGSRVCLFLCSINFSFNLTQCVFACLVNKVSQICLPNCT